MTVSNQISLLEANTLEIHYKFNDFSHTMDAIIQNKCEYEFIGILKELSSILNFEIVIETEPLGELSSILNFEIVIETEPLGEGGLRRWFKIISKAEGKKATITTAVIVALLTGILVTPITSSISETTKMLIEKIFEDKEIKELEKEKLQLEIKNLQLDIEKKTSDLNQNIPIKKRKSNFYEALENYEKIEQVSFSVENENKYVVSEKFVTKNDFKKFVLTSDDLDPIIKDNATIEIISPVLKKGNYKWMGIYQGESSIFKMKSNEFKTLVQVGDIQFKNGTSIDCCLEIKRKIDNEGTEKTIGYNVLRVNRYFESDNPIETPEGKKHRQFKEAEKQQLKLFTDLNE